MGLSCVYVSGWGAVTPAGWGMDALRDAVAKGLALPVGSCARPGWQEGLAVRTVPAMKSRPGFLGHARLRRSSGISQFAVGAALEALGGGYCEERHGKLGVVVAVLSGCVSYSRRFYQETMADPATASPLVFPETVFNAPASHLSAYLGSRAINYTLVGDTGTMLQGIAMGAGWIAQERVDSCLVVGVEEMDWLTADGLRLFDRRTLFAEGAGAVLLSRREGELVLEKVTDEHLLGRGVEEAVGRMKEQLMPVPENSLLVDGVGGGRRTSAAEERVWGDWKGKRITLKRILGEGLMAGAAWQCAMAADGLMKNGEEKAVISVVGKDQHAIGAVLGKR